VSSGRVRTPSQSDRDCRVTHRRTSPLRIGVIAILVLVGLPEAANGQSASAGHATSAASDPESPAVRATIGEILSARRSKDPAAQTTAKLRSATARLSGACSLIASTTDAETLDRAQAEVDGSLADISAAYRELARVGRVPAVTESPGAGFVGPGILARLARARDEIANARSAAGRRAAALALRQAIELPRSSTRDPQPTTQRLMPDPRVQTARQAAAKVKK
jgi:hypothetical protein